MACMCLCESFEGRIIVLSAVLEKVPSNCMTSLISKHVHIYSSSSILEEMCRHV